LTQGIKVALLKVALLAALARFAEFLECYNTNVQQRLARRKTPWKIRHFNLLWV